MESSLEFVRQNIGALRIVTDREEIQCAVSVSWVDTTSLTAALTAHGAELTRRALFSSLELAMAEAKWRKDCVVRTRDPCSSTARGRRALARSSTY